MKYNTVAMGGTFDHLHKGHVALLTKSFSLGDLVLIGVTSDDFASRQGKVPDQSYLERVEALEGFLRLKFPGRKYIIAKLDDYFGPGIASPAVDAIVVTRETAVRVPIANRLRKAKGYPPLAVEVVGHVLAADGRPISSTRIRRCEIDAEGRILRPAPRDETPDPRKG